MLRNQAKTYVTAIRSTQYYVTAWNMSTNQFNIMPFLRINVSQMLV